MGVSVAERRFQMQDKLSRRVREHAVDLTFEFHKIGGAGVHQYGWFFTLNWTNPHKFPLLSLFSLVVTIPLLVSLNQAVSTLSLD
jgi:hypothetical protein